MNPRSFLHILVLISLTWMGPATVAAQPAAALAAQPSSLASQTSTTFTQIVAGWYHTCALTTAGGARCWGRNVDGEFGDGMTHHRLYVAGRPGSFFTHIAAQLPRCAVVCRI